MSCPKPKRIKDPETIDYIRTKRDGCCMVGKMRPEYGACWGPLEIHHITTRGAHGDDIPKNLIGLCSRHHQMAQNRRIPAEELRSILSEQYHYVYDA